MLTTRQLATMQAALQYWQEEMVPHGHSVMRSYYPDSEVEPLTFEEVTELSQQLQTAIRYAVLKSDYSQLAGLKLFTEAAEAQHTWGDLPVATVILPISLG